MSMRKLSVLWAVLGLCGAFAGCGDVSVGEGGCNQETDVSTCNNSIFTQCKDGKWENIYCALGCENGLCKEDPYLCSEDLVASCNGDYLEECKDGHLVKTQCAFGCEGGVCNDDSRVCSEEFEIICNGDYLEECKDGHLERTQCAFGCENGACKDDSSVCSEDFEKKCNGDYLEECKGGHLERTQCAFGCENGACKDDSSVCSEDFEKKCNGDYLEECKGGHLERTQCAFGCENGACKEDPDICLNDQEYICEGDYLKECKDGRWDKTLCENGCDPDIRQCNVNPNKCEVEESPVCEDDYLKECKDGYWVKTLCEFGCLKKTEEDQCNVNPNKCDADGEKQCDDEHYLKECSNGYWLKNYCQYGCEDNACKNESCPEPSDGIFYICDSETAKKYKELDNRDEIHKLVFYGLNGGDIACNTDCTELPTDNLNLISGGNGVLINFEEITLNKPIFNDLNNVTIDNIKISNLSFRNEDEKSLLGGLANVAENVTLRNVEVEKLSLDTNATGPVGGLFGKADTVHINGVKLTGETIKTADGASATGGLIGELSGVAKINNVENETKSIIGYRLVGGFVGNVQASELDLKHVKNTFNKIMGNDSVAGFIGNISMSQRVTIDDIYNNAKAIPNESNIVAKEYAAGFIAKVILPSSTEGYERPEWNITNIRNEVSSILTQRGENEGEAIGAAGFISQINVNDDSNAQLEVSKIISKVDDVKGDGEVAGFVSKIDFQDNQAEHMRLLIKDIYSSASVFALNEQVHFIQYDEYGTQYGDSQYCFAKKDSSNEWRYYKCAEEKKDEDLSTRDYIDAAGLIYSLTGSWFYMYEVNGEYFDVYNQCPSVMSSNCNNSYGHVCSYQGACYWCSKDLCINSGYVNCDFDSNNSKYLCHGHNLKHNAFFNIHNNTFNSKLKFDKIVLDNKISNYSVNYVFFKIDQNYEVCNDHSLLTNNIVISVFDKVFYNTLTDDSGECRYSDSCRSYRMPNKDCWFTDYNYSGHVDIVYTHSCKQWSGTHPNVSCNDDSGIKNNTSNVLEILGENWIISSSYNNLPIPLLVGVYVSDN